MGDTGWALNGRCRKVGGSHSSGMVRKFRGERMTHALYLILRSSLKHCAHGSVCML